jgi:hypothetical protein
VQLTKSSLATITRGHTLNAWVFSSKVQAFRCCILARRSGCSRSQPAAADRRDALAVGCKLPIAPGAPSPLRILISPHRARRKKGVSMNKLSLLDLAFFVAESEASPKHVGGLMIYKRPARSPASFVADLYRELLTFDRCPGAVQPHHPFLADRHADLAGKRGRRPRATPLLSTSCRAARTAGRSFISSFPNCISRCSSARGRYGNYMSSRA